MWTIEKMPWRHLREWPRPANCRSGSWKSSFIRRNFLWGENAFKLPCVPEMPRRLLLYYSSYRGQAKLTSGCFSCSPKQGATGQAGSRPWNGPCKACVDVQSYKATETSTHISTAGLEGQAVCNGIGVLGDSSWEAMCEAVKMKPRLQWRCQELGRAAKKSCRPDNEWRHSRTRTCGEQMARLSGWGWPSPLLLTSWHRQPSLGHVGTGLNACLPASPA